MAMGQDIPKQSNITASKYGTKACIYGLLNRELGAIVYI